MRSGVCVELATQARGRGNEPIAGGVGGLPRGFDQFDRRGALHLLVVQHLAGDGEADLRIQGRLLKPNDAGCEAVHAVGVIGQLSQQTQFDRLSVLRAVGSGVLSSTLHSP